jgi:nucleotide-binding universal stress UspA family protein
MILVSYDGSDDAKAAVDHAARLMPGAETLVLTVWEPLLDTMLRTGFGLGAGVIGVPFDTTEFDESTSESAGATAAEGAERATAAGLAATPRAASSTGGVAATIQAVAAEARADAIVMGTRGLAGVKSMLLGSVSHAVLQHADRAVLIVPSPSVVEHRRGGARGGD